MAALLTAAFPLAARASVHLALAARVALGIFHSSAFPAMAGCWAAWAPPLERTQLNGIAVSGASIGGAPRGWSPLTGTLVIFTLAGYVAEHLGWEAIFYVTG